MKTYCSIRTSSHLFITRLLLRVIKLKWIQIRAVKRGNEKTEKRLKVYFEAVFPRQKCFAGGFWRGIEKECWPKKLAKYGREGGLFRSGRSPAAPPLAPRRPRFVSSSLPSLPCSWPQLSWPTYSMPTLRAFFFLNTYTFDLIINILRSDSDEQFWLPSLLFKDSEV